MRTTRNQIYIILMVLSMLLLLAFQVYWLYSNYKDQRALLKREAASIFSSLIREQQDSMIYRNFVQPFQHMVAARDSNDQSKRRPDQPLFPIKEFRIEENQEGTLDTIIILRSAGPRTGLPPERSPDTAASRSSLSDFEIRINGNTSDQEDKSGVFYLNNRRTGSTTVLRLGADTLTRKKLNVSFAASCEIISYPVFSAFSSSKRTVRTSQKQVLWCPPTGSAAASFTTSFFTPNCTTTATICSGR